MQPTLLGFVVAAIGMLAAILGSTPALLSVMMLCGLMLGAGAIALPALGGSTIPPAQLALGLLLVRVLVPGEGKLPRVLNAVRDNWMMIGFALYGLVGAIVLPRIFAGQIDVPPLRFAGLTYIFDTVPLAPSSQNITTPVYLIGTTLVAICTYVAISYDRGPAVFIRTAIIICWTHATLGLLSVFGRGTPIETALAFFRNGAYAQLDQSYNGFIRMNGIAPEPSSYAAYGFGWFVLVFECWMRGIWPRLTGATALLMTLILVFSTSGSAYVGLAGYGALLLLRLLIPGSVVGRRLVLIVGFGIVVATVLAIACIVVPSLLSTFGDMLLHMTVDKSDSNSGLQRAFWAKKGLEAFVVSHGLGIGAGSFRSSSLATAILGSSGVIGAVLFIGFVVKVLKPLRQSTHGEVGDLGDRLGAAASWAAVTVLIPASVAAPSLDPGTNFALFCGAALALRRSPAAFGNAQARIERHRPQQSAA